MRHAADQRGAIALLVIVVGSTAAAGNGVDVSSPPQQQPPPQTVTLVSPRPSSLRVRFSAASTKFGPVFNDDAAANTVAVPSSPAAAVIASRVRGGAANDGDPRDGRGGYYRREEDRGRYPPPSGQASPRRGKYPDNAWGPREPPRFDAERGPAGPRRGVGGDRRHGEANGRRSSGDDRHGHGREEWGRSRDSYDHNARRAEPTTATASDGDKKRKSWFSLRKDKSEAVVEEERRPGPFVPPPPSTPPPGSSTDINPADTERTPIHYVFPAAAEEEEHAFVDTEDGGDLKDGAKGDYANEHRRPRRGDGGASARRDAVTTFMSRRGGGLQVRLGSAVTGAALGGFFGKVSAAISPKITDLSSPAK